MHNNSPASNLALETQPRFCTPLEKLKSTGRKYLIVLLLSYLSSHAVDALSWCSSLNVFGPQDAISGGTAVARFHVSWRALETYWCKSIRWRTEEGKHFFISSTCIEVRVEWLQNREKHDLSVSMPPEIYCCQHSRIVSMIVKLLLLTTFSFELTLPTLVLFA